MEYLEAGANVIITSSYQVCSYIQYVQSGNLLNYVCLSAHTNAYLLLMWSVVMAL